MIKISKILIFIMILTQCFAVFAFDESDEALLEQYELKGKKILLHNDKWAIAPSKIDIDGVVLKGQGKSLIDWENMDHNKWLDFNYWVSQRKARDKNPKWKLRLRESTHVELFAKVIKCVGTCLVYRGESSVDSKLGTSIKEGDEIKTLENSFAWILISDGSIARVSPKTSITFSEINLGMKNIFLSLRLNHGHLHWQVRQTGKFEAIDNAETDLAFYPLALKEANREYFSIEEYTSLDHDDRLKYLTRNNYGYIGQTKKLNSFLKVKNDFSSTLNTQVYLVTPNQTYFVQNSHFDAFYAINSNSYFRHTTKIENFKSTTKKDVKAIALKRGYNNKEEIELSEDTWYQASEDGRELFEGDYAEKFKSIAYFVKRIPTIHLAREILLRSKFQFLFEKEISEEMIGEKFGYRLWNLQNKNEIKDRLSFLKEYTRRVETTNLNSLKKVFKGIKLDEFNEEYYEFAINKNLIKLKGLYSESRMKIPKMSEIEYYVWVLKNK